jgi:hypothetical protein
LLRILDLAHPRIDLDFRLDPVGERIHAESAFLGTEIRGLCDHLPALLVSHLAVDGHVSLRRLSANNRGHFHQRRAAPT